MSYHCDERYDVYDERRTTARKAHECDACDQVIAPGDIYYRIRWVYDGSADGVKRCIRCQFIHEHLRELGDGDMWPAEKLDCGEDYEPHWGRKPPEHIAALAFWSRGESLPAVNLCEAWERVQANYYRTTATYNRGSARRAGSTCCRSVGDWEHAVASNPAHGAPCTEAA